jgi:hypothetical protein
MTKHENEKKAIRERNLAEASKQKAELDFVLEQRLNGYVVMKNIEGLETVKLDEFIKVPVQSILWHTNRTVVDVLINADDPRWVNDLALVDIVIKLKEELDKAKLTNKKLADKLRKVRKDCRELENFSHATIDDLAKERKSNKKINVEEERGE